MKQNQAETQSPLAGTTFLTLEPYLPDRSGQGGSSFLWLWFRVPRNTSVIIHLPSTPSRFITLVLHHQIHILGTK
jgi:hypothetical protein